ncbi:hypothetical protein [Agromyces sp. SYSU T00194]|uniref:hypothetical protein n=1 Tax=Agromyces chitinivorans TaxID=3158560 RepID=UPI0033999DCD
MTPPTSTAPAATTASAPTTAPSALDRLERASGRLAGWIGSSAAFWTIFAIAALSGAAIALVARPFLLYDEFYHVGIVDAFAGQAAPFPSPDPESGYLGDVTRLPSYLYHYLLSFPYRLAVAAGASEFEAVVLLRLITVAITTTSLIWFRRIGRGLGLSGAIVNTALLVFVMLPVVPFVAATVNYDGPLLLLTAIFLWRAMLVQAAPRFDPAAWAIMLGVGAIASVTKYTFLPVFAAAIVMLLVNEFLRARASGWGEWWSTRERVDVRSPWTWIVGALLAIAFALVLERIGWNLLAYGTPNPSCGDLHAEEYCRAYGPYRRNADLRAGHETTPIGLSSAWYFLMGDWIPWTILTSTTVGGETPTGVQTLTGSEFLLNLLRIGTTVAVVFALLVLAPALRNGRARLLVVVSLALAGALFVLNYNGWRTNGIALAIQARYLMPVLPVLLMGAGFGVARTLRLTQRRPGAWKAGVLAILLVVAIQCGGPLIYFAGATPGWVQPESVLAPLVPAAHSLANIILIGVAVP